jgi:hypothetical protein
VAAYLQAKLGPCHKIYVADINKNDETEYLILRMVLYGLKQAGHKWYEKLQRMLEEGGSLKQGVRDEGTYAGNGSH